MAAAAPPGLCSGPLGCLFVPRSSLFQGLGCPRSGARLWCGVSMAKALTWLGLGSVSRWHPLGQTSLCPALGGGQHLHTPHEWSLGFSRLSICPSGSPTVKGACLLCVGPQDWDTQSVAWPAHSPVWVSAHAISLYFWVPSQGHRSQHNAFLPVLLDYLCIFLLQPWLYRSPSASFQLVFHENCFFFSKETSLQMIF